jgi:hypothetical protein
MPRRSRSTTELGSWETNGASLNVLLEVRVTLFTSTTTSRATDGVARLRLGLALVREQPQLLVHAFAEDVGLFGTFDDKLADQAAIDP